jgi:hypothetical protein
VSEAADYWQGLLGDVMDIAGDYVKSGVRVSIKTNLGPEIPVFTGSMDGSTGSSGGGFSVSKLLGLKAAVVVRDAKGGVIANLGSPPATEPLKAIVAALLIAGLVVLIVRGVVR